MIGGGAEIVGDFHHVFQSKYNGWKKIEERGGATLQPLGGPTPRR